MSKIVKTTKSSKIKNSLIINLPDNNFFIEQHIEGLDCIGDIGDIIAFNEKLDCHLYENIRQVESLKHELNIEFVKHLSIAKQIIKSDNQNKQLRIQLEINTDFDQWLNSIKKFYNSIFNFPDVLEKLKLNGIGLKQIEYALDRLVQYYEYEFKITKNDIVQLN